MVELARAMEPKLRYNYTRCRVQVQLFAGAR